MEIFITILGAFVNRCRGGLLNKYHQYAKRICKYGNAVVFGVVAGLLIGSWYAGILATLGMFIGSAFGWGKYIGGIINKTFDPDEVEVRWIDWLVMQKTDYAQLRSVVALSLRGLIWTSCIAVSVANWNLDYLFYAPVGLLMGIVYYITISISKAKGWSYGEWVFGALLWGTFTMILTN